MDEDKRAKFLKSYANVPEDIRNDIIAVVDGKTYTWTTAYIEIKDKSGLGWKLLKVLGAIGLI